MMRATLVLLAACNPTSSAPVVRDVGQPPVAPRAFAGTISVPGGPAAGDVLLVGATGVLARAPIVDGRYEFAEPGAATSIVIRLAAPAIGARQLAIANHVAPSLALAAGDVVHLRGTIEMPATFDWVELAITPANIAPTIVLWADAIGGLRGSMTTEKLAAPQFDRAVLAGRYRITVDRTVDGPKGTAAGFPLDRARVGTTDIPLELGGVVVELSASADATFEMRAAR